jgi:hypothetical protein
MILRVVDQQFKVLERFKQGRINALSSEAGAINDMVSLDELCKVRRRTLVKNVSLISHADKPLVSNKRNLPPARMQLAHARTKWSHVHCGHYHLCKQVFNCCSSSLIQIAKLPLSFVASILGMNAAGFSDGALLSLHTIFAYICESDNSYLF